MKSKQEIFDRYAQEQLYADWFDLQNSKMNYKRLLNHIFNATDLVCKQALENASNESEVIEIQSLSGAWYFGVDKQSITNTENIPK